MRKAHLKKSQQAIEPWLFTRRQAATLLSCSVAKLMRLEAAGRLKGIKLDPTKPTGIVYYARQQLLAIAGGE